MVFLVFSHFPMGFPWNFPSLAFPAFGGLQPEAVLKSAIRDVHEARGTYIGNHRENHGMELLLGNIGYDMYVYIYIYMYMYILIFICICVHICE